MPSPGTAPEQPADHREALTWFEEEHQVLLAAITLAVQSGFDVHAWQLPWALTPFLQTRGHWQEWAATQRTALAAATRLGDLAAQAVCGRLLAVAYSDLGDHDESARLFTASLALYQRLGNRLGEAKVQFNLAALAEAPGPLRRRACARGAGAEPLPGRRRQGVRGHGTQQRRLGALPPR